MHSKLRYTYPPVFTVDAAGGFPPQHQAAGIEPPLVPCWTLPPARVRAKTRGCGGMSSAVCLLIMVLLIVFAVLGLGAYQIMKLQTELLHLKQEIHPQSEGSTPQRLVGHQAEDIMEPKHTPAAHLIGQKQDNRLKTLKWESRHGRAFTDGILYRDGGLQVNETGHYFVYSRVEFQLKDCKPRDSLIHTVYIKRGERLLTLMIDHREGFCQVGSKEWSTVGSNLGSMHQLMQYDWVFVNVSQPTRLSSDHQSNYFGLFKLP
ncbi:tumor necrosis factor ligand superfamily member 6 [Ictalurus furcatus]|uniref:tumor necrosis factor ligand superfamily member 6 n=1 Tax=Ictalurus furcatus TaxID=66913 RepID=UPI00234FCDD2|nr:tumor necrosis factor ligand superfamily member 6 [Ictalurus furcatus]